MAKPTIMGPLGYNLKGFAHAKNYTTILELMNTDDFSSPEAKKVSAILKSIKGDTDYDKFPKQTIELFEHYSKLLAEKGYSQLLQKKEVEDERTAEEQYQPPIELIESEIVRVENLKAPRSDLKQSKHHNHFFFYSNSKLHITNGSLMNNADYVRIINEWDWMGRGRIFDVEGITPAEAFNLNGPLRNAPLDEKIGKHSSDLNSLLHYLRIKCEENFEFHVHTDDEDAKKKHTQYKNEFRELWIAAQYALSHAQQIDPPHWSGLSEFKLRETWQDVKIYLGNFANAMNRLDHRVRKYESTGRRFVVPKGITGL